MCEPEYNIHADLLDHIEDMHVVLNIDQYIIQVFDVNIKI
jgi:hypothetical protein